MKKKQAIVNLLFYFLICTSIVNSQEKNTNQIFFVDVFLGRTSKATLSNGFMVNYQLKNDIFAFRNVYSFI